MNYSVLLVVLLFSCGVFSYVKAEEGKIVGRFSTKTGSSCRYAVMDFKEDNKTGLHIKCSCPGGRGSNSKKIQYSCVYFGVPKTCDAFLDNPNGPEIFFSQFADFIQGMWHFFALFLIV